MIEGKHIVYIFDKICTKKDCFTFATEQINGIIKKIVSYLKQFIEEDFCLPSYLYFSVFLTVFISINYVTGFEDNILDNYYGTGLGILYHIIFYGFAYYGIAIPIGIMNKESNYLSRPLFWVKSLLLISIIGLNNGYFLFPDLVKSIDKHELYTFVYRISSGLKGFVFYLIPLLLIKYFYDKKEKHIYGLTTKGFDYKPYLYLLLLITPFIIGASFQSAFRAQYPFFKAWKFGEIAGLKVWQTTAIYEVLYGISFVFLEWVFRGALILGLVAFMGKKVMLPMVATYAFLHFGKPLPETISSIFGGYILGVIAFYTKSVFGGCLIHIGIAYLMDFSAIIQHYFGRE